MNNLDKEFIDMQRRLTEMQRLKVKAKSPKKVKSLRPVGRPRVNEKKIQRAKELAKDFPIADVALKVSISVSTLYRHGINRKILNAEKGMLNCTITD